MNGLSVWAFPNTVDPRAVNLPDAPCAEDVESLLLFVVTGGFAAALRSMPEPKMRATP